MYVQVCPQPQQAAARLLRAVLLLQEVHKVQDFLLLFRRQIAEFFEDLFFNGHGRLSGDLLSLYACCARFRAIWRGEAEELEKTVCARTMGKNQKPHRLVNQNPKGCGSLPTPRCTEARTGSRILKYFLNEDAKISAERASDTLRSLAGET